MKAIPKSENPAATGFSADENTNILIVPPAFYLGNREKEFATLRAQFAITGHALHSARDAMGVETYLAGRWGFVRYLSSLDDARRFLVQIGGAA